MRDEWSLMVVDTGNRLMVGSKQACLDSLAEVRSRHPLVHIELAYTPNADVQQPVPRRRYKVETGGLQP